MPRWKKNSLIGAGIILGILLLSMLIVPWQIKKQGITWFAENTTRQLSIDKVYFNPFTLTIRVQGLKLTEQQSDRTFVAFERLMLSGSARSLIDLAVILDRVELDKPYVNIELLGKQEFNFSDFTRLGKDQPQEDSAPPEAQLHFSFNNIVINGGRIEFTDQTSPKKSQHRIDELSLAIPFIGNVPYLTNEYVEPQLRFLLNGSEISAVGLLKPFHHSLETTLSLVLNEIDLVFYAFHSPVPLPVEVNSGTLDTQIDLTYRISKSDQPKLLLNGELALTDIDIREPDGKELFRLPTLILDLDWSDVFQQDFKADSLAIYEPELFVNRNQDGVWNFQQLLTANTESDAAASAEDPAEAKRTTQPLLKIGQVAMHDGRVHLQDAYPLGGFNEEIQGINLQLDNLSTHLDEKTDLTFNLRTALDMSVSLQGQLGLNPLLADLSLLLNGFQLQPHYPYLADLLTRPLGGNLNLASTIQFGPEISLKTDQMQLTLHQLKVPFTDQDGFTLQDLNITGGSFDLQQQLLKVGNIQLSKGNLLASRDENGELSLFALLREKGKESTAPDEPSTGPVTVELPWQKNAAQIDTAKLQLLLSKIALDGFDLQFTDNSLTRKPQLKVADLAVSLTDLAYPESQQSPFKVSANVGKKGRLDLSGTLAHSPLRVQAQTQLKALPLADFNDFLPEKINVSLKDGKLYTNLAIKLQEQPEAMTGSFSGQVSVSDFNLRDPLGDGELLAWENLNLAGIKGEIAPFKLDIREVSLNNYLAKILINPEGQINLARMTAAEEPATEAVTEPEAAPELVEVVVEEEPAASGSAPDIRIDALTLQGGTVSFTDRSLPNVFSATMYKLGGRVTGMASDEQMQADVDLRGELENHSPLTIVGKLNLLSKDLYADLTIRFMDIDLAPMSPYSGTYLGYLIDKGKLNLDLSYQIEHQKIKAENKIMIDQFTLGDSVKSDKATSLPVSLAIALLKDSNDEIHLDVPLSGDLSDPSFSIAGAFFTILKNILVKAATAPFSLLASMLGGGGGDDFTNLTFASGIARMEESQQETLGKLAAMLAKRPSLTLEISAYADPDKDPEAYRQDQLRQTMIAAKWQELKKAGQTPGSRKAVSISAEEYPIYLLQVYREADFPRPRNFVGMLKKLPEEEMEKLLLANIRADDERMQELAQSRAHVVRDSLIAANEGIKSRLFLKTVDIFQPPEKGPASRVEFSISSK